MLGGGGTGGAEGAPALNDAVGAAKVLPSSGGAIGGNVANGGDDGGGCCCCCFDGCGDCGDCGSACVIS